MMPAQGQTLDLLSHARKAVLAMDRRGQAAVGNLRRLTRTIDIIGILGSQGTALAAGNNVFSRVSLGGPITITGWSLAATIGGVPTAGDVAVDVFVGATLATVASICGATLPTLTTHVVGELSEQSPGHDWNVLIPDPSTIVFRISTTGGTLQVVSITLKAQV